MLARVKQDYKYKVVRAFSGHDYIKGEWRVVPRGCENEALRHPMLDVKEVLAETKESEQKGQEVKASPQAVELAKELGLDLANIAGTGKDGAIKKNDVVRYVEDMD